MLARKITDKFQTTIPQEIRDFLKLRKGDFVLFEIEKGQVKLKKISSIDLAYLKSVEATLTEWNSEEDDEAYKDL